jgi:hypothetical protein
MGMFASRWWWFWGVTVACSGSGLRSHIVLFRLVAHSVHIRRLHRACCPHSKFLPDLCIHRKLDLVNMHVQYIS